MSKGETRVFNGQLYFENDLGQWVPYKIIAAGGGGGSKGRKGATGSAGSTGATGATGATGTGGYSINVDILQSGTDELTATQTGGVGPVTFLWKTKILLYTRPPATVAAGGTTAVMTMGGGPDAEALYECTVTDSNGIIGKGYFYAQVAGA